MALFLGAYAWGRCATARPATATPALPADVVKPAVTTESGPDPVVVFLQQPLQLALAFLRSGITLWLGYWWFFRSLDFVDVLANQLPLLHTPTFLLLALVPAFCVKNRVFEATLTRTLLKSKLLSNYIVTQHVLRSCVGPVERSIQAMLVFFSSNLLFAALPNEMILDFPRMGRLVFPDPSAAVTGLQVQLWFRSISIGLLRAVLCTLFVNFLMAVKAPPDGKAAKQRDAASPLWAYWTALRKGRGPALVLDLLISLLISCFAILPWLRVFAISPEAFATFGGAGGLALGFASQTVIGNLVSGFLLLVTQPFAVGDEIHTGDRQGIVKEIGWGTTTIEAQDGSLVMVPNQRIVKAETVNLSVSPTRVIQLTLPIVLPCLLDTSKAVAARLQEELATSPFLKLLLKRRPRIFFNYSAEAKGPTVTIEVMFNGTDVSPDDADELRSEVLLLAVDTLHKQGVKVLGTTATGPGDV